MYVYLWIQMCIHVFMHVVMYATICINIYIYIYIYVIGKPVHVYTGFLQKSRWFASEMANNAAMYDDP